jgi:L-ascorbate metabolism protein UlaG (beta-lactamase superfamily)
MTTKERWLSENTQLYVGWQDRTEYGGPIGNRIELRLRELFADTIAAIEHGDNPIGTDMVTTLRTIVRSEKFAPYVIGNGEIDRSCGWRLNAAVLHPEPALTKLHQLTVMTADKQVAITIHPAQWAPLHAAVAALTGPGLVPDNISDPDIRQLIQALDSNGYLQKTRQATCGRAPHTIASAAGATLVGHACVLIRGRNSAVLVDPYMPVGSGEWPPDYQPLKISELGRIDAVLLTHGHPDHFDAATLLRIPTETPIVVPQVDRESILSPDLEMRLHQLGFTDVRAQPWGACEKFGDIVVQVLPFYGEQPSVGAVLHPEISMVGNTYVVETGWGRVALLADAGDDRRGRMIDVARREREVNGPVDIVFSGFRGWCTSPAELLGSSVGRYALFIPPHRWGSREELMNDPRRAVTTTSAFGARTLVPYADGGAPWFWEVGLGPRLDETAAEKPGFDLYPEQVAAEAAREGVVRVAVVRAGETLEPDHSVTQHPGHVWPWRSLNA